MSLEWYGPCESVTGHWTEQSVRGTHVAEGRKASYRPGTESGPAMEVWLSALSPAGGYWRGLDEGL